jgi:hypothetical protein
MTTAIPGKFWELCLPLSDKSYYFVVRTNKRILTLLHCTDCQLNTNICQKQQ